MQRSFDSTTPNLVKIYLVAATENEGLDNEVSLVSCFYSVCEDIVEIISREALPYFLEDQSEWDKWLPYATFVLNTTPHTSTCFTPKKLFFRKKAQHTRYNAEKPNYIKELQARLQSRYEIKMEKSEEYHDRTVKVPL